MSQFVKKASTKIEKLPAEEILRIIDTQNSDLKIRNVILDNSFEGSLMVSDSGNVMYLNNTLTSLMPLASRKKYADVNVSKVIVNNEILSFIKSFLQSSDNHKSEFFEVDDPSVGTRALDCSATRLFEYEACLFIFRDVTFFNRFKEEFRKNESLAQMTTMAAGVAHEIKNPLASISIYLQLMDKMMEKNGSMTREEAHKYLDVVSEEVDRINKIAVDFLFAVKPMKVDLSVCNINDIVRKTVDVVKAELAEKGIELGVNLATSLPKVFADCSLMQQSILNLVKNAMQAMPQDRKNPSIVISTFIESDMVKISVQDNGCGMTEDQMSKIFEPYYTTKSSGTGLGLTVLFKIMKQHGGDVTVHSTQGEGSEFILQIPVPQNERFRIADTRQGE
ncbi:MAG: GHKL domain-containing protein [Spirochaetales bacterium]|nr:GHKL domain-containing protein [Spirochaetales bacterium]